MADLRTVQMLKGHVYFLTDEVAVKIGFSMAPRLRQRHLQGANHRPLRIIDTASALPEDEHRIHKQFEHLHIRGEWFRMEPELMDFIEEYCGRETEMREIQAVRRELSEWAKTKSDAVANRCNSLGDILLGIVQEREIWEPKKTLLVMIDRLRREVGLSHRVRDNQR